MDRVLCFLIYMLAAVSHSSEALSRLGIGSFQKWEPGQKLRILLVGYNGARNTGSDVRVVSIARQLKKLFGEENLHITVMTMDESTMEGYFDEDVELLTFSSLFPLPLFRACSSHHAAILCEGSTLKSTFANALTLFLCEAAGVMAGQHKPCIAYGSEVGKMDPFLKRAAARLCKDTYFITRTQGSLTALRKLGLNGHAGTDAAWFYDKAISSREAEDLLRQQGWDGSKPLLGIAVIDPFCWPVRASLYRWIKGLVSHDLSGQYDKWYFFSDSAKRRRDFKRYIDEISKGVNEYIRDNDSFPVLIGMERLDEKACRLLQSRLTVPSAMFLSGDTSADVMTGILRSLSALVTSRYHASVLSMEKGCPIVAVSMDERLDGILKELRLNESYLLHTADEDLGKRVYDALTKADAERELIRCRISHQVEKYTEDLSNMGFFMKRYIEKEVLFNGREYITDRRNRLPWHRACRKARTSS